MSTEPLISTSLSIETSVAPTQDIIKAVARSTQMVDTSNSRAIQDTVTLSSDAQERAKLYAMSMGEQNDYSELGSHTTGNIPVNSAGLARILALKVASSQDLDIDPLAIAEAIMKDEGIGGL